LTDNVFNQRGNPVLLNNFGFLRRKIPTSLYQKLLKECQQAEKKNIRKTSGLKGPGVAHHYYLSNPENIKLLTDYIFGLKAEYDEYFPGLGDTGTLNKNVPYVLEKPWINVQRAGQFIPSHTHDGVYSYSLWMQIPYNSGENNTRSLRDDLYSECTGTFEFTYTNIFGAPMFHRLSLSKKDEGSIIMFPSKLRHSAYPFYGTSKVRLCVSVNILYDVSQKL